MQDETQDNVVGIKQEANLFARSVKGGFWLFAIRIFTQIISVGRYIILMNILAVSDMGLLGVALLLMNTLDCFTSTGFDVALIQKDKEITPYLNTSWTIGIIRACLLFAILYISAPVFATPTWKVPPEKILLTIWVIRVTGISFFFNALKNPGIIHFQKELQFHKQFALDVIPTFISVVVTIVLVLIYKSVWSLVLGRLSANIVQCVLSYVMHSFRPKFSFDKDKARELWSFAKWVFASTILSFLMTQGDDYFVWGYLGYASLGLYLAAYKYSNIPTTEIIHVIGQVSYPAYSKLQNDIPRLKEAFFKVQKMSISLSVPVAGIIFILAPQFVKIFFDTRWLSIIKPMQILAVFGLVRTLGKSTGPIFQAVHRPDILTKIILIKTICLVLIIYPLTRDYDISGTSLAILIVGIVAQPIAVYYLSKILKFSIWSFVAICIAPFTATGLMAAVIVLLRYIINDSTVWGFCLMSAIGVCTYLAVFGIIDWLFGLGNFKIIKEQLNVMKAKS